MPDFIRENVPLAPFTTLRIGGPARFLATVQTEEELLHALAFARAESLPTFVLGGGSNLVVADSGFPGVVLHLTLGSEIVECEDGVVSVDAGVDWGRFTRYVCEQGSSGVECLAGIPGLVGACPIQNIGAYGQEVASTIRRVRALDLTTLNFVELSRDACGFAYRTSIFNGRERGRYIITRVDFAFDRHATPNLSYVDLAPLRARTPPATPLDTYHAVREIRDRKGMLLHPEAAEPHPDTRSAGSFFKNPIVPADTLSQIARTLELASQEIPHWAMDAGRIKLPAAWLIERAGFPKGFRPAPESPVGVSTRHTLALTNHSGTASCAELLKLREQIVGGVRSLFGVTLEQEPVSLP